ncbi:MAG: hypothetical protein AVO35_10945 [Candidatus Aegiribacteria sp. MLS_C]|nr:MAG: hypothetical protein AVO35_10945 [Candidatus Aegiribacteria sp. MLS_C]
MKIRDFACPSCGASLKIEEGKKTLTCPYCESTVIVPDSISGGDRYASKETPPTVVPTITVDTSAARRTCSTAAVSMAVFLLGLGAAIFFWIIRSNEVKQAIDGSLSALAGGSSLPVAMEFGGEGMRAGFFQDAQHICVDQEGRIFVGEYESGKVQIFSSDGSYQGQWDIAKSDAVYLYGMDISRDGKLYLVYDSELYVHDASTGVLLGQLQHPDGWGFDDVAVCDDGSVVAAWYCNSDDILRFHPDGSLDFVLREAVSTQGGEWEMDPSVIVDGGGNIFVYGSFNGSFFKFSPNGRFLDRFGSSGDRPGQFTSPVGFCTDPMGRVWVSDFGDLLVFGNDGTYLATLDPGRTLYDICISDDYQLYGITYEETVVQYDLRETLEDLQ